MSVYVQDADLTIHLGDVRAVLPMLADESVDCCVTSPPYWGLRDYGADGQLGAEPTPSEYVAALVDVMREVRRVLRPEGTLWLNLGDSYNVCGEKGQSGHDKSTLTGGGPAYQRDVSRSSPRVATLKRKDMVGVPWRVAFALQDDGWYLRSDIIWSKPNPMPESVTDRPTKSHEYLFLLSRSPRYFFDQDAVREPAEWNRWGDQTVGPGSNPNGWIKPKTREELNANRSSYRPGSASNMNGGEHVKKSDAGLPVNPAGRNVRSVWEIATTPYAGAHFATFPQELARRCILAGCPEGGTVLDPFFGAGTTGLVARAHGRKTIGIELNADYAALAAERLSQLSLLAEPATSSPAVKLPA